MLTACRSSANPSIPGNLTSLTKTPAKSGTICLRACSAESKAKTSRSASCNACWLPIRTAGSSSTNRTFKPSDMSKLHCRVLQFNDEFGAALRRILRFQRPSEVAHYPYRDGQSQPQILTLFFCGKERFEQVIQDALGYSCAAVAHRNKSSIQVLPYPDFQAAHWAASHRIKRIREKIHQHLCQAVAVA